MLDQKLAEAMQRILSRTDKSFTLTATLQRLIDVGIGTRRGKSITISDADRQAMREWLEAKGFPAVPVDLTGMSREETLAVTPHEKASGEAVKRNRISIKALAGQVLVLAGQPIHLPEESHLDVDWTRIVSQLGHRCIMVVENYENFNRIHATTFKFPLEYRSPLVVYRGDPQESRADNVQAFLLAAKLPVMAFVDVDPAGILIASNLPGLVGMVTPTLVELEAQLSSPQSGRRDLFRDQYPLAGTVLSTIDRQNPLWRVCALVLTHRSAVVQERWIEGATCVLIAGDNSFGNESSRLK